MKLNNPFLIQGYYSPEYFCDRNHETTIIRDALYNGRNLTLIAPRRMGKTGLIKHAFHIINNEQPDIITLYMDIYPTQNLGDFVKIFASTVLGQLDSIHQKAINRVTQFIKSCRPVISFDEFSGLPQVNLELEPNQEQSTLKEIFEYLASSEKHCYIAIDEFQQINEYPEKGIEALLRSYIQFIPNVSFIFAGSKQHVMQEMFLSAKKPFYQSTQIMNIGPIDIHEYYNFAERLLKVKNLSFSYPLFEKLYNDFYGHTWYIQAILNRIYGYGEPINQSTISYAINNIVDESEYSYENLLRAYSINNVKLIKAIAKENLVKEITSQDFISKHHLGSTSSINSSLKKLLNNELVYRMPNGYIIYDRFMNEWLRKQMF